MRIESKLCHLTENKAVVQVIGWLNDKNQGSALAEGPTVEAAEDKAISRLNKRIEALTNNEKSVISNNDNNNKNTIKVELPNRDIVETKNVNQEPSDWSNELTAIDLEIKRLKWSREDENHFLEKKLGYNNRSKITNYNDIVKYLSVLKKTDNEYLSKEVSSNFNTLIEESDVILRQLSWNQMQGREHLQKEFNVSSRKELSENQLTSFIEQLKLIRNQYLHK